MNCKYNTNILLLYNFESRDMGNSSERTTAQTHTHAHSLGGWCQQRCVCAHVNVEARKIGLQTNAIECVDVLLCVPASM